MRARGLKHIKQKKNSKENYVAPHAGAWIETQVLFQNRISLEVAPHAGAWIETLVCGLIAFHISSRAPCGRVD